MNQTGRYEEEFRYISLCGKERNFVRSHDTPVVFTHARKVTEYFDNIEFTPMECVRYAYRLYSSHMPGGSPNKFSAYQKDLFLAVFTTLSRRVTEYIAHIKYISVKIFPAQFCSLS
jgi:hypothetical protein